MTRERIDHLFDESGEPSEPTLDLLAGWRRSGLELEEPSGEVRTRVLAVARVQSSAERRRGRRGVLAAAGLAAGVLVAAMLALDGGGADHRSDDAPPVAQDSASSGTTAPLQPGAPHVDSSRADAFDDVSVTREGAAVVEPLPSPDRLDPEDRAVIRLEVDALRGDLRELLDLSEQLPKDAIERTEIRARIQSTRERINSLERRVESSPGSERLEIEESPSPNNPPLSERSRG